MLFGSSGSLGSAHEHRGSGNRKPGPLTWKLVVTYLGWLLAAGALALLFALVIGEVLALFGVVESGSGKQQTVVEVATVAWFVVFALLPFLLRHHILKAEQ